MTTQELQLMELRARVAELECWKEAAISGLAVFDAMDARMKARTSAENISDVLDTVKRLATQNR